MENKTENKQLRCCIYARVSSDDQAGRNFSVPAQVEACRYYAKGKGWTVVAEYHDGFESARPGKVRPTFEKMMEAARRKEFDVIIVHKLDRFARDDYEHVVSERELEKLGIRLESVSEPMDVSSPAGYLSRRIMQVISSWYIKNLAVEAKKGMKQKVAQGGWPWLAPLGYINRKDKTNAWVDVDPKLGPMITEAFKEMATGKYTIDEWTARAFNLGYRNRTGGTISRSKWHDLFHHRFYLGKTGWGRKGEEQDGNHPALTDPMTFAQVQEVLAKHDHYKKRVQRHDYLLRGLVYSLDANSPCLVTTQPSKGMSYYRSKTRVGRSQVYYNCQEIDTRAGELVKSMAIEQENRPRLEAALNEWFAEMGKGGEDSELGRARQRLEALVTKRKNINRMAAEELITWSEFKDLRNEIESEEAALKSRVEFITRHQTLFAADFEVALDIVCNLNWLYEEGGFNERRLLVETLFERLNVRQGKIESYELNPPFSVFYDGWKDTEPGDKLVRFESLVAGEEGFEPSLTDPESAVLPLDDSPVQVDYS
jgi:site-specific DNA recombinase